jgi:hypothetical protein
VHRLRQGERHQQRGRQPDRGEVEEGHRHAHAGGDIAGDIVADRSADTGGEPHHAERQVEASAVVRDIGDHQRDQHTECGAGDSVEHLGGERKRRRAVDGEQQRAQRQHGEADQ